MKKFTYLCPLLILISICLSGCGIVGDKMTNMSAIYAITAIISLLILIGFNYIIPKKDIWYQLLFASIFIVNLGYFTLSISKTLEEALLANRISYLGSVFLPLSMFLLILNVSKIKYKKWLPCVLLIIGAVVFLIAASPGYSDIYYKEVSLSFQHGATLLNKVYGPFHCIYLYYLLGYFTVMVIVTVYAATKKKIASHIQANILLSAVLINIFVWLIEQLIPIDFEMLSISYIISELFLISLQFMITEHEKLMTQTLPSSDDSDVLALEQTLGTETADTVPQSDEVIIGETEPAPIPSEIPSISDDRLNIYREGLSNLTPTERVIYNLYISGSTTKEIMASLNIKENTLKFHNKNIYGKLGVSSRKQLIELNKQLEQ